MSLPRVTVSAHIDVDVEPFGKGWRAVIENDDGPLITEYADTPGEAARNCIDKLFERFA